MTIGTRIAETGTLISDDGGFALRRDAGGRWKLDLHARIDDLAGKRVRITGTIVDEGLIHVDSIGLDIPAD